MTKRLSFWLTAVLAFLIPSFAMAQTAGPVTEMHQVLMNVYNAMIPMCSNLINVSRAISAIGTSFYIGVRVWKHIAKAEEIDFFPLFRPMVLTILLGMYPQVLDVINAILKPSVTATAAMVTKSNDAVHALLIAQAKAATGTNGTTTTDDGTPLISPGVPWGEEHWEKYQQPDNGSSTDSGGGFWSTVGSGFKFLAGGFTEYFRFFIKFFLSIFFEVLFYAASLCIDTIRTFHLVVLAILGPFVFCFSCYDGFQHSLNHWLARYVNIYLWLPVSNIFGALLANIQANMLQIDLDRVQNGSLTLFSPTDFAYLIFLAIGVVGYFTIPGITNYIIHTHGPNPLAQKVTQIAGSVARSAFGAATGGAGGAVAGGSGGSGGGGIASTSGFEDGKGGGKSEPNQYNRDKITG